MSHAWNACGVHAPRGFKSHILRQRKSRVTALSAGPEIFVCLLFLASLLKSFSPSLSFLVSGCPQMRGCAPSGRINWLLLDSTYGLIQNRKVGEHVSCRCLNLTLISSKN